MIKLILFLLYFLHGFVVPATAGEMNLEILEVSYFPGENNENIEELRNKQKIIAGNFLGDFVRYPLERIVDNVLSAIYDFNTLKSFLHFQLLAGNADFLQLRPVNFSVRKTLREENPEYFIACEDLFRNNINKILNDIYLVVRNNEQIEIKQSLLKGYFSGIRALSFAHAAGLLSNSKCSYLFYGKHYFRDLEEWERGMPLNFGLGNCQEIAELVNAVYPDLQCVASWFLVKEAQLDHVYNVVNSKEILMIIDAFSCEIYPLRKNIIDEDIKKLPFHFRMHMRSVNNNSHELGVNSNKISFNIAIDIGNHCESIDLILDNFMENFSQDNTFSSLTLNEKRGCLCCFYGHRLFLAEQFFGSPQLASKKKYLTAVISLLRYVTEDEKSERILAEIFSNENWAGTYFYDLLSGVFDLRKANIQVEIGDAIIIKETIGEAGIFMQFETLEHYRDIIYFEPDSIPESKRWTLDTLCIML